MTEKFIHSKINLFDGLGDMSTFGKTTIQKLTRTSLQTKVFFLTLSGNKAQVYNFRSKTKPLSSAEASYSRALQCNLGKNAQRPGRGKRKARGFCGGRAEQSKTDLER